MSRSTRDKGLRGEREVATILRSHGLHLARVPNSGGLATKGDLTGLDGYHFEVKRQEIARFPLWLRQARTEAGIAVPVVVWRPSRSEWTATLPLDAFAELLVAQVGATNCPRCGGNDEHGGHERWCDAA